MDDEHWMNEALKEARQALDEGEIPIGAVIVSNGRIIARGHNMTEALADVTAHAEMLAITAAESAAGKYLDQCTLYVTLEPCLMCAGAIAWSQLRRIVYGANDPTKGYSTFLSPGTKVFHPKAMITSGVKKEECAALLKEFFESRRR